MKTLEQLNAERRSETWNITWTIGLIVVAMIAHVGSSTLAYVWSIS